MELSHGKRSLALHLNLKIGENPSLVLKIMHINSGAHLLRMPLIMVSNVFSFWSGTQIQVRLRSSKVSLSCGQSPQAT